MSQQAKQAVQGAISGGAARSLPRKRSSSTFENDRQAANVGGKRLRLY